MKIGPGLEGAAQDTAGKFIAGDGSAPHLESTHCSTSHEAVFKITETRDCPNFKKGDAFKISGNALFVQSSKGNEFVSNIRIKCPAQRSVCQTLVAQLTKILITHERVPLIPDMVISCGHCHGAVTLKHRKPAGVGLMEDFQKYGKDINTIVSLLKNFSIFKTLDESNLKDFVTLFRLKKYNPDTCIIRKGDPGSNLFIILSGRANVHAADGTCIARLGDGEVFGEMSLISGGPAEATVSVVETTTVLLIKGQDFLQALKNYPTLQMYFAWLISRRLSAVHEIGSVDLMSTPSGRLDQISPLTLVQSINCRQLTGILKLTLLNGFASLAFREGKIVDAEYKKSTGKQAFYAILGEVEGGFHFEPGLPEQQKLLPELGMFVEMLFEGLRRLNVN